MFRERRKHEPACKTCKYSVCIHCKKLIELTTCCEAGLCDLNKDTHREVWVRRDDTRAEVC